MLLLPKHAPYSANKSGETGMLTLWKRWRYRHHALSHLYTLLFLYPRGRENLLKDYPGILDSIRMHFREGTTPQVAALFIAARLLTHWTEHIPTDQRALLREQLLSMDIREIKRITYDAIDGKLPPPGTQLGTILLGHAMVMARHLVDNGEVEQFMYDAFASEVFGALAGKSPEERSSERIERSLAGLTSSMEPEGER